MALAGDMVQLAERFREALAERARAGEGAPEDAMDASMEADLISMGISSPVTKATSGALYHRELSRQVSGLTAPSDSQFGWLLWKKAVKEMQSLITDDVGAQLGA